MKGTGISYGAVSIVNGISTNTGIAMGNMLRVITELDFEYTGETVTYSLNNNIVVDNRVIDEALHWFIKKKRVKGIKADIKIYSEIPPSVGLKSSSAVAISVLKALYSGAGDPVTDSIVAESSFINRMAMVSITGAYDDAAVSYYGGIVAANNRLNQLVSVQDIAEPYIIIIAVPSKKNEKSDIDKEGYIRNRDQFQKAIELFRQGKFFEAMELNGDIVGGLCNIDLKTIRNDLRNYGVNCVSISGTGPAIFLIKQQPSMLEKVILYISDISYHTIITQTRRLVYEHNR